MEHPHIKDPSQGDGPLWGSRNGSAKDPERAVMPLDSGEARLHSLGYKQELKREFGFLTSTCASLGLMAFSSGLTGATLPLIMLKILFLPAIDMVSAHVTALAWQ